MMEKSWKLFTLESFSSGIENFFLGIFLSYFLRLSFNEVISFMSALLFYNFLIVFAAFIIVIEKLHPLFSLYIEQHQRAFHASEVK